MGFKGGTEDYFKRKERFMKMRTVNKLNEAIRKLL